MKVFFLLVSGVFLLGGCAELGQRPGSTSGKAIYPSVVFRSMDSCGILSCLNELRSIRSDEFDAYFQTAEMSLEGGDDEDKLRYICLSLNTRADYAQFRQGVVVLEKYIVDHPDYRDGMHGLLILIERLDQAKINRWSKHKKLLDERDDLVEERDSLAAEIEILQGRLAQEKIKITELKNQIEQLKNIENIIKNREH